MNFLITLTKPLKEQKHIVMHIQSCANVNFFYTKLTL